MNKYLYRVVFNRKTGALTAVAETAKVSGNALASPAVATRTPPSNATVGFHSRFTDLAVNIALLCTGISTAAAQIVVAPNAAGGNRPVIDNTGNGHPLVQIVAPNAAGISHNQYQQFNVDRNGAILNNATGNALTQQGGWVAANPNLAGGAAARLIVNEVTSNNPSQLRGYLEVAGQRADVVVSNPNGIMVDGFGFINASRGVLSTGVPMFGASGSLDALRVTQGNITVTGAGLNDQGSMQVDLIARSVQVNAGIWADRLNVVTGANQVNYADLGVQVIQGSGDAPTIAIDVASIGGMYANRIKLVGTEAGVGVTSYGKMAATGGDFSIDNAGKITLNGNTSATGNIIINSRGNSGDINNTGSTYAQQSMQITAASGITNTGVLAAQSDVVLQASDIASSGTITAGVDAAGNAAANGKLILGTTGVIDNSGGSLSAKDNLILRSGTRLINRNGVIQSGGSIDITATGAITNDEGRIEANGAAATTTLTLAAGAIDNNGGRIVNSGTGATQLRGGAYIANNNMAHRANRGIIGGNGSVMLASAAIHNSVGAQITAGSDLSLQFTSLNNTGDIAATRDLRVAVTNALSNSGSLSAVRHLSLTGDSIDNSGLFNGGATTSVRATTTMRNVGRIYGDDVAIGTQTLTNDVDTDSNIAGVIAARNTLQIGAAQVVNREHALLQSLGDMGIGGALDAGNLASGSAVSILNDSATIDAGGTLRLQTAALINRNSHFRTTVQNDPTLTRQVTEFANWTAPDDWFTANRVTWSQSGGGGIVLVMPNGDRFEKFYKRDYTQIVQKTVVLTSDPGTISAGGNMLLSGKVTNDKSVMVAGGTITGMTGPIDNIGATGTQTTIHQMTAGQNYYHWVSGHPHTNYYHYDHQGKAYDNVLAPTALTLPVWRVQEHTTPAALANPAVAAGSPQDASGMTAQALPPLVIPNNALFRPGQHYVVETDPQFTAYNTFLSSAYLLNRLALDPQTLQKRLGDGFYEQKLISEQITQLTGKRLLTAYNTAEDQYKALMDAGVASAARFQLTPGIALTAAQMAALTFDMVWLVERDVTLADGTHTKALAPVVYLSRVGAEDIGITGSLISGKDIDLTINGSLNNGGTLLASNSVTARSSDIRNTGRIQSNATTGSIALIADNDVNSSGSIQGNRVGILAGRDVMLQTTTATTVAANGRDTQVDRVSSLNAAQIALQAGRDIHLAAASINTSGDAMLAAGRDLNLSAVKTQDSYNVTFNRDNHVKTNATHVVGTEIITGGALTLAAGQDITTQAAYATAGGQLSALAGRDVHIGAAQQESTVDQAIFSTSKGMFSSSTTRSQRNNSAVTNVGSTLSGDRVSVAAGHDLDVNGSNLVGTNQVTLAASGDINIASTQDIDQRALTVIETKSGAFTGGNRLHVGTQITNTEQTSTGVANNAGTIGSINGSVTIAAGNDVNADGLQLQAKRDIDVSGRNVNIAATVDTFDSQTITTVTTSGLRIGAKSNISDAAMALRQATSRGQEVNDPRLKALYAAKAAYAATDLAALAKSVQQSQGGGASGKVSIGIGTTVERRTSTAHVDTVNKAQARAGGQLNITAKGDATPDQGDINLTGATLQGDSITLDAKRDLNTRSQAATNKSEDKYQKIDLEVGLYAGGSIGGSGGAKGGLGIYGSAAYQQSKTELSSTTHEETTLDATNKLSLKTGRDASLTGTVATADSIKADIGRNLSLKSEQDVDRYRQQQLGGQIEGRYAFGNDSGVSGSLNYSQTKSDYKSVQEQTGLNAGKGGFDITVGKHTQLDGATIASTATPDKNKLSTDTLGHSDLKNEASYSALSANISFGGGGNGGGSGGSSGLGSPIPTTILPGLGAPTSDSKSTTTKSAIAAGTITVKQDQQTGTDSTNNLSRDTANANQKLDRIFDANKVAEQQEMGRVLGEVGNRVIGDLSQKLNLKDGSPEKIALHAALGALQAGAAGGNALAGAAAAGGMEWLNTQVADYLVKQPSLQPTGNKDEDAKRESQRKVIQQWAALIGGATIGGAIGGNGTAALAGGATSLDAERFNRQLHEDGKAKEKTLAKKLAEESSGKYTQAQIEDALRSANNNKLGETASTGAVVPYDAKTNFTIYDKTGMMLGKALDGSPVLMQNPAMLATPPSDLQSYIKNSTGNTYSWNATSPQLPATPTTALPSIMPGTVTPEMLANRQNNAADAASWVSTQSGRFSSAATAYGAYLASQPNAVSQTGAAIQFGMAGTATVVGFGAGAMEQFLRPNMGQTLYESTLGLGTQIVSDRIPLASPLINEFGETIKGTSSSKSIIDWINEKWNSINRSNGVKK